jgi:ATP/maltotriose-dependent transcriptional regulator MalT
MVAERHQEISITAGTMAQDVSLPRGSASAPTRLGVDRLIDESYAKLGTDPIEALRLATSALRRASRLRYTKGVARSHLRAGQGHWQLGEHALALEQFEQGLIASRRARDRATQAMCINGLGVTYDRLGNYESALACFERFIDLSPAKKDLRAFVMATVNIGHVLERTEQLEEAAQRYRSALDTVGEQTVAGLSMLWMNFGVCLSLLGRHDESARQFERALAAFLAENRPLDAVLCRLNLAETAFHLGDEARTDAHLSAARVEAVRLSAVHLEWRTVLIDGLLHAKRKNYPAALALLTDALAFSERCDEPDLLRMTHQELSQAHEALGDNASALHHYKVAAEIQLRAAKALAHTSAQHALQSTLRETAALLSGTASKRTQHRPAPVMPRARPRRQPLSEREQEVMQRLARGLSNRAIGEDLGISTFTARYHVSSIFDKLGVSTRGEAVTRALGAGLIQLDAEPAV